MTDQTRRSTVAAFGAEPSSSSEARAFVREALERMGVEASVADRTELVVSELVTNAVLHAQCGPVVTVQYDGHMVRLEVEDSSEAFPLLRNYGGDAVTGRGLAVVDASTNWWGVDATETGKSVWAEFAVGARPSAPGSASSQPIFNARADREDGDGDVFGEPSSQEVEVCFIAVPVDVYLAMEQHNEALLREFELLNIGHANGIDSGVDSEILEMSSTLRSALAAQINDYREAVHNAFAAGQSHVNLRTNLYPEVADHVENFLALARRAEEMTQQGLLLTAVAPKEVAELRAWFAEEMNRQVNDRSEPRPAPTFAVSHRR